MPFKRALVVDNNRAYTEMLGRFLASRGLEVLTASDGAEALEQAVKGRPDVIFLDLVMPKIDGAKVCSYLKGREEFRDVPIIILSGVVLEDIYNLKDLKADAFVAKMQADELLRSVGVVLEKLDKRLPLSADSVRPPEPAFTGFKNMNRREVVIELLEDTRHKDLILNSLGEGVLELSAEGKIVYSNAAAHEILDRDMGFMANRGFGEILDFTTAADRVEELATSLREKKESGPIMVNIPFRERTLKLTLTACRNNGTLHGGVTVLVEDVTESHRMEASLQAKNEYLMRLNRIKNEFITHLSHDLRTPLNPIIGFTDLLLKNDLDDDSKRFLRIVRKSSQDLLEIINGLTDLASIETGRLELDLKVFDLNKLIEHSVETLLFMAEEKGMLLEAVPDEQLSSVWGDPYRTEQVVWNFITNAIKFSPPSSRVTVTVQALGRYALVRVIDQGPGIPPEEKKFLFERFGQGSAIYAKKSGGSGIGLALCRTFVTMQGGAIGVESGTGKGSIFHFTIPLANGEAPPTEQDGGNPLAGVCVLAVDSNAPNLELIREIVTKAGGEFRGAASEEEALGELEKFEAHVVLFDISRPDSQGDKLLARLAEKSSGGPTPVLAVTPFALKGDEAAAAARGFSGLISGQLDPDRLVKEIRCRILKAR